MAINMDFDEKLERIFSHGYVCNHCLGRQFAKLLTGFSNSERGEALRRYYALKMDAFSEIGKIRMENFSGFKFHNEKMLGIEIKNPGKCSVCNGLFGEIEKWVELSLKASGKKEFSSFSVGTSLSDELLSGEESLWEAAGVDFCEPIKAEINREIGKRIEKKLGIRADLASPQGNFLIDLEKRKVIFTMNPLFIYGEYQKLVRGIPQTKWPSGKYKTSVEQIIAKPVMKMTKGTGHSLHGLGREDIDARCLGWRPFVLEIANPEKRKIGFKKIQGEIAKTKKVNVRALRSSTMKEVRVIKDSRAKKQYCVTVSCDCVVSKGDLKKLRQLIGEITQRTPERVKHRRADIIRKRRVFEIKARQTGEKAFLLYVTGEAGLYIKELVSGDDGRTKPSVSSIIGCKCIPKNLDVLKISKQSFKI